MGMINTDYANYIVQFSLHSIVLLICSIGIYHFTIQLFFWTSYHWNWYKNSFCYYHSHLAEMVWKFLKARIVKKTFKKLEDLSNELTAIIQKNLTAERIKSITNFSVYTINFMSIYDL